MPKTASSGDVRRKLKALTKSAPERPQTAEKAQRTKRGVTNTLNDLTAKEWIPETVSVWIQKGLGAKHEHTKIEREHPAPFSYQDVARLIRFFTKKGGTVLDPFVGVGSTLKACALNNRRGIGIELSPHWAELARKRLETEVEPSLFEETGVQEVIVGDARKIVPQLKSESIDLVLTSPPYWNILSKIDHKARSERLENNLATQYSNSENDLGNISDYNLFVETLVAIFKDCRRALKPKGHACIIVSDFRHKSEYVPFHSDLYNAMTKEGWNLKGITILHQKFKRVFPYGYPAAFVPNLHHQYILIFRNS